MIDQHRKYGSSFYDGINQMDKWCDLFQNKEEEKFN